MKQVALAAVLTLVAVAALALTIGEPINLGHTITGFRVGGNEAKVDLVAGTWTFLVYPNGSFGDKEFGDLGITNIATSVAITPQDLADAGIPLASQVTLRNALQSALTAKVRSALE